MILHRDKCLELKITLLPIRGVARHGGDFRFQLFLHAAKLREFLDLGLHAGV